MRVSGRDILRGALDLVGEVDGSPADRDGNIALLARNSKFVLDSINASVPLAVAGPVKVRFDVPADRSFFPWSAALYPETGNPRWSDPNPADGANEHLPTAVEAWTVQPGYAATPGFDYEEPRANRLLTTEEWANLQYDRNRLFSDSAPFALYWSRRVEDDDAEDDPGWGRIKGTHLFHIWPRTTAAVTLYLYALVPKFSKIDLDRDYEIDQGRSEYLRLRFAVEAAALLGLPVSPEVHAKALEAADHLGEFRHAERTIGPATRRWEIGMNRGYRGGLDLYHHFR